MRDGCDSCGTEEKALHGLMLCVECREAFECQGRRIKQLEKQVEKGKEEIVRIKRHKQGVLEP